MRLLFLLVFWFGTGIGYGSQVFGQQELPEKLFLKKHYIFYNITNFIDPNGSSLQFGYNYQAKSWIDLQMELGFVSDNLIPTDLPFEEYAGFRIRPQVKFLNKNSLDKVSRFFGSVLLSYQRLNFKENNNFEIEGSFNQNITYRGNDQTFAWYLALGLDTRSAGRFVSSFSLAIGKVYLKTKIDEGNIPENATVLRDCRLFCGRNDALNSENSRPGILIDFKIGYQF